MRSEYPQYTMDASAPQCSPKHKELVWCKILHASTLNCFVYTQNPETNVLQLQMHKIGV